jgi:hypothetical protein
MESKKSKKTKRKAPTSVEIVPIDQFPIHCQPEVGQSATDSLILNWLYSPIEMCIMVGNFTGFQLITTCKAPGKNIIWDYLKLSPTTALVVQGCNFHVFDIITRKFSRVSMPFGAMKSLKHLDVFPLCYAAYRDFHATIGYDIFKVYGPDGILQFEKDLTEEQIPPPRWGGRKNWKLITVGKYFLLRPNSEALTFCIYNTYNKEFFRRDLQDNIDVDYYTVPFDDNHFALIKAIVAIHGWKTELIKVPTMERVKIYDGWTCGKLDEQTIIQEKHDHGISGTQFEIVDTQTLDRVDFPDKDSSGLLALSPRCVLGFSDNVVMIYQK